MRTLKFTFNVRINPDANISISTESVVSTEDEALQEGREARMLIDKFIEGYSEDET